MKVMGTGSRSAIQVEFDPPRIYKKLEERVLRLKAQCEEQGDNLVLISGMAEGWDEMIAMCGLRNEIPYVCVIPTRNYIGYYWGRKSLTGKNRIPVAEHILGSAFDILYLDDIYGKPAFMQRGQLGNKITGFSYLVDGKWENSNMWRNQVMVDMADLALVYEPRSAGTKDCVARLKRAGVPYEVYPF